MSKWNDFWFGAPVEQVRNEVETRSTPDGEPSPAILPPSREAVGINPKEASRIGTVYRSVNIISTMISQMPLEVYRGEKKINTPLVIQNPIEGESQRSFVQQVVWSLALWGNAYVRTFGDPVSSVEVLDPDSVTVTKDPDTGKTTYYVGNKVVPAGRIRHLKLDRMPGQLKGIGPLTGMGGELKAAYLLDKFQQTWFDTTGTPRGILSTTQTPNATQSAQIVEAWNNFLKGSSGQAVLPFGMTYEAFSAKPMEVQYIDVAEANIRNIARIFGIPAANLLSAIQGTSMTYTNYIESNIQFYQNTLSNYMNEIEQFLSSLLPRNQRVEFNEEQLLRMSPEKLWAVKKTQYDVGYYDGAEQRKQEGLPALPKKEAAKPAVVEDSKANSDKEVSDNGNGD
ncbi:phage portal protein [Rhodococcus opacus]|uniref:Putative phage portal protein n=1 Tax=Rhodococcus opacus (strain B4) TaxID=632772 RepID=C1B4N3_RHOOB|nr:phage portal protein [Rhodococcus opacus]BAH55222.1 putative phage portal protein [Rhodococcus opacus B4]